MSEYLISGMDCAHCAQTVEKGVSRLAGVRSARVDFATAKLHLEGDISETILRERLQALGYGLVDAQNAPNKIATKRGGLIGFWDYLLSARETQFALIGGLLILLTGAARLLGLSVEIGHVLFTLATLIAGYPIARSGLRQLFINRDFNINLLMTIAGIGAIAIGETLEAATVIFLFAVGESLEGYTADRARDSIRSLMSIAPAQATRLITSTDDGDALAIPLIREEIIPIEDLKIGDRLLVKAGERIPMDGHITAGESDINQAPITGESLPVMKSAGESVFAGTINGAGLLQIEVTHLAADNTLSRIIRMVEEAQSVRAPSQRMVDQFARVYTPAVVMIAALIATLPPLVFNQPFLSTADTQGWLYRALTLLVISCPCALVISAPVTVISAITAAARRGVLIKGGAYLEVLGVVRAFAFDKTGTLTQGQPILQSNQAIECSGGQPCAFCDDVLALAAALERRGAHPIALAVVTAAQERQLDTRYPPAEAVQTLTGAGIRGQVGDRLVTIGSHRLFDAEYPHERSFCERVKAAEADGQTTMLLSDGERVRGFIGVADQIREDSRRVVAELIALGNSVTMLTGDHPAAAQRVGEAVGVTDVRANLLPQDKVGAVQDLLRQHGRVAMVGDGINDTPALVTASVGIAMGGAGSPQALETAHIALMSDNLAQLPFAVRLSRFARSIIKQNIAISFATKLFFLSLALTGGASLWAAILADVGVSLLVTLNGMRPLRFE